jgi:hypothetical protein
LETRAALLAVSVSVSVAAAAAAADDGHITSSSGTPQLDDLCSSRAMVAQFIRTDVLLQEACMDQQQNQQPPNQYHH